MIYIDFEFRGETIQLNNSTIVRAPSNAENLILLAYRYGDSDLIKVIDLRRSDGRYAARKFFNDNKDHTMISFNAVAELQSLLSLGVDISVIKIIDLMVEARIVAMTHPSYYRKWEMTKSPSLLNLLDVFGVETAYNTKTKSDARSIIIENEEYTDEQWDIIVDYGKSDIEPMKRLFLEVGKVHDQLNTQMTLDDMRQRGEYIKATTYFDWKTKGFPINSHRINQIFDRKHEIFDKLVAKANEKYTPFPHKPLYVPAKVPKHKQDLTQPIHWIFKKDAFAAMLERKQIPWERTETGQPVTKQKYFEQQTKTHSYLKDLYRTMRTFHALNGSDLRKLIIDRGDTQCNEPHIRAVQQHFTQKTGRSSPKPAQGYLLNLTPWLRSALIHPHGDEVFVGADWKSQEIGIAAALSEDVNLLKAYLSRDVYLALAIMAGAIPEIPDDGDAWKKAKQQYSTVRQNFKSVQLGINYGKQLESLSVDVYNNHIDGEGNPTISLDQARIIAGEIYSWHKTTFSVYWQYLERRIINSKIDGFFATRDNWIYFINDRTRMTQLMNLPSQSEAAHMLRRAVLRLYNEHPEIDVVCTLHDAIYILSDKDNWETHAGYLKQCMEQACEDVLGVKFIKAELLGPYTQDKPYWDERGQEQYETIASMLDF